MGSNKVVIDGETYLWQPDTAAIPSGRRPGRNAIRVFWLPERNIERRVEIGRLKSWSGGAGWVVIPRLGGRARATEMGKGLGGTRLVGIRYLLALAQAEPAITPVDKVRLRIVRDGEGGTLVDDSKGLVAVPEPLAAAA